MGVHLSWVSNRCFFMAQVLIRILAIAFTAATISILLTSHQNVSIMGITTINATYNDVSAFKFLFVANIIVCAFSVLSLAFLCCLISSGTSKSPSYFILFVHDMVIAMLMLSGCAAANGVGYVGKYGQTSLLWLPVCGIASKLCHKMLISLVMSYLAFSTYLALSIMTAYKLALGN